MGTWNSGRRPAPTKLHMLRGNPSKKRLNPEPEPAAVDESFDIPPPELADNEQARAEWQRVAPLLRHCGLVSQAERSALLALCFEWSAYLGAQEKLRVSRLVKRKDGVYRLSPQVAISDRALSNCHWLWHELGLTPSGRAKIATRPPKSASPAMPPSKWQGVL